MLVARFKENSSMRYTASLVCIPRPFRTHIEGESLSGALKMPYYYTWNSITSHRNTNDSLEGSSITPPREHSGLDGLGPVNGSDQ